MRNLPLLLALLLLAALGAAAAAPASPLPAPLQPASVLLEDEEGEAEDEIEEAEDAAEDAQIEREICEEDPELCEEEAAPDKGKKVDECLLKKASATVTANPGKRRLRLTVHYKTLKPATVNVEALLRSAKGIVYLGNEHTRFRRSGVYRDTFQLPEKQMKKAATAREFEVELQVVNTPASCRVELSAHRAGAKKLTWS